MNRIKELDRMRSSLEEHVKSTAQKMGSSAFCIALFTDDYTKGIDSLLQFSIAIMLDKPIFLLVPDSVRIPEKVKRVVDGIEFYKYGDEDSAHKASTKLIQQATEKGFSA